MNQARQRKRTIASKCPAVDRAREHYEQCAWAEAYHALSLANQRTPLGADDLERLAMSAYLTNGTPTASRALERCHQAFPRRGRAHARRARRVLARLSSAHARRDRPRDRLVCPRSSGSRR